MDLLDQDLGSNKKISFKKEIFRFLKYWPWIILSLVIFYLGAYFYLKYTQPKFLSKTTLLFQESKSGKGALGDLKSLGMGISGDNELQGEAAIIVSKPILNKVVKNLNLGVSFFIKGKIREVELYNYSPYTGRIINEKKNFYSASYILEPVDNKTYRLTEGALLSDNNLFRYGYPASLPFGTVIIEKIKDKSPDKVKVVFKSETVLVKELEGGIVVKTPSGLLMDLTLTGPIPQKSEDILNELSRQYNIDGINDKNIEAQNTEDFIDNRLGLISVDLEKIEGEKENFKKTNKITDLDVQAGIAVNRLSGNVENIFNQSVQLEVLNAISDMVNSGKEQLFPTGLGLPGATESLLTQYNELLLTKKRTLKQATVVNPTIKAFDIQLAELLVSIRKNIQESREQLQRKLGQTNFEMGEDKAAIYKYPTQEKIFRNIERQRNLKESLYLYLLQKREENAITLAVTAPKAKVVNPAYTVGVVNPNYNQIKTASLIMGLLFPLIILFIVRVLDTKIRSKEDIESLAPHIPVIAEIPFDDSGKTLIEKNDFTIFAESFRILISNIKFILRAKEINEGGVILVTSSVKGEGKTTVSVNTALSLSGSGKVLLIGADIRNPQLHRFINRNKKGLTDYLVSGKTDVHEFISNSGLDSRLDVLFSGAKAPNPNDLLDMKKFDDMIDSLKKEYDYIIMDSAPVMLVSDSMHLIDIADLVLYTVKSEFSDNEMISFAQNFRRDNQIDNMVFALNAVKPEYSKYGYKYGYGYYSYTKPTNRLRKLFNRK
ncbi:GumC family protein [Epilithonimonas pallida]|uniref:non-specific protein-tyrosine kinase n=1 Tax=Epilithonimonas pallida TaxID=373671 RepID=A0ABY1R659_9FLAO|nr:tyrosine-protein kinase [Epilithonimonas pallida]SMP96111.1 capsular exopolysaccharide family [Epilithonimonas pallida]